MSLWLTKSVAVGGLECIEDRLITEVSRGELNRDITDNKKAELAKATFWREF